MLKGDGEVSKRVGEALNDDGDPLKGEEKALKVDR